MCNKMKVLRLTPVLILLLAGAGLVAGSDLGVKYGDSIRVLSSARQAGSGGVALEDPWRQGSILEANSVLLTSGLHWYGLGYQGGLGTLLRIGCEGFLFSTPEFARTTENLDGSYGGTAGKAGASEYGGRILAQIGVLTSESWKVAALCRINMLMQSLPSASYDGFAIEAGMQAQKTLGNGSALTVWALAGPLGSGAGYGYAGQINGGVGIMSAYPSGLLKSAEGYAIGAEGRWLMEGLMHGGLGLAYWFGKPWSSGITLYLRAGAWYAESGSQILQPRGGIGVLWRNGTGLGVQFDYAVVPAGELGMYHYVSLGLRLPEYKPRADKIIASLVETPKEEPAVALKPDVPVEEVMYFQPTVGEKARVTVEAKAPADLAATLWDGEGRSLIRVLIEKHSVNPGTYQVEWDGTLGGGMPAQFDIPYMIRITLGDVTRYIKVVAKEQR